MGPVSYRFEDFGILPLPRLLVEESIRQNDPLLVEAIEEWRLELPRGLEEIRCTFRSPPRADTWTFWLEGGGVAVEWEKPLPESYSQEQILLRLDRLYRDWLEAIKVSDRGASSGRA